MLNLAAAPLLFSIENELILVCWRGGYDDDDDGLMKQCFWYVCALYVYLAAFNLYKIPLFILSMHVSVYMVLLS